jgi:D-cysteine desulfhydrase
MAAEADALVRAGKKPYVIPEGGSNATGALGYVAAAEEIAGQLASCGGPFDAIAFACGSGGTAAGLAVGARAHLGGVRTVGFAVCDDAAYFRSFVERVASEASERFRLPKPADFEIDDRYKGIGYAQSRPEELARIRDVARLEGLVTDPVYTGKAMHGLLSELEKDRRAYGRRVLFVHTGGVYGLFAKGRQFEGIA